MNREQMIAWLCIEGWELYTDKMETPLIRRGNARIWINRGGNQTLYDTVDNINPTFLSTEEPLDACKVSDRQLELLLAGAEKYRVDL